MRRILIAGGTLLTCCLLYASGPSTIRTIRIQGNHALSERRLLETMSSKPNSRFSPSMLRLDIESLLNLYHQNGYYTTEVTIDSNVFSHDSSTVEVFLSIKEGEQIIVGEINLEGNTAFTKDEILHQFDTQPGKFLDPHVLERDMNDLLSRYDRIGYPFAKVEIHNIGPVHESASSLLLVDLSIDEGLKIHINEIRVTGNKETHENVIVRETRIKPGETFDQEKIRNIQQRLNRLNIFSSVSEPELYVTSTGGGVLITVQEGTTNTFDGVVGYAPGASTGEQGTINGLVNVFMRNLFGTSRKLNVHWQKEDRYSQEIALRYVEPWILDVPVNLSGSFLQRQQDTLYVRRAVEMRADLLVTESFSIGALFNHESIIPSSTIHVQTVFNSSTMTTGVEFLYDSRDDIMSPTGGVNYRSDYQIGNKKIFNLPAGTANAKEASIVRKISLDADVFLQPVPRQVIAVGLHGRQFTGDRIEVSDLYRFGGTNTLRGYRENQFLGSRIAWTNTEYRFLLARHSFFYGFFDSGYYFLPEDDVKGNRSTQHLKYGYGIGIRLETSLGNIGVSFALGEGDSFSQSKIHFGLINEF